MMFLKALIALFLAVMPTAGLICSMKGLNLPAALLIFPIMSGVLLETATGTLAETAYGRKLSLLNFFI
jgi:hypothetical protein